MVKKIAKGQNGSVVYQTFKEHFGVMTNSSSLSWAEEDMATALNRAAVDAVAYVAQYWAAVEEVASMGLPVPEPRILNKIFAKHDVPVRIEPPELRIVTVDAVVGAASTDAAKGDAVPNRFTKIEQIGQGGFGTVFRVSRSTSVATFEYALKILDPSAFVGDRDKASARFRRESAVLQRLQHRAVIDVIETGMIDDLHAYILMPLIRGRTLRDCGLSVLETIKLFVEILDGLHYLHNEGVIHRDLKPSNLIVRESDRQPIILDFGCAFLFDQLAETTITTSQIGSIGYVPLEVQQNPKLRDSRQDIYACGIMLYEVLAGRRPVPDDYKPLATVAEDMAILDPLIRRAIG
ncbi:MAG: serine/threonine protein kinase, partial [Gemmatimonas sp.]|nr:serine/threonine protein kinase [Gemmatimonas sp.]